MIINDKISFFDRNVNISRLLTKKIAKGCLRFFLSTKKNDSMPAGFLLEAVPKEKLFFIETNKQTSISKNLSVSFYQNKDSSFIKLKLSQQLLLTFNVKPDVSSFSIDLEKKDQIFGLGGRSGGFALSEQTIQLLNKDTVFYSLPGASYSSFPFIMIKRGGQLFAILIDETYPLQLRYQTTAKQASLSIQYLRPKAVPSLSFAFIIGNAQSILKQYGLLTGRPAMPPLWSIGYHQSRWSYKSQKKVVRIAQLFRHHQIPLDAIHLDIHYMQRYRVFTWQRRRFRNPSGMNQKLRQHHVRSVAIVDPGVALDNGYLVFNEGLENNHFCHNSFGDLYEGHVWPGKTVFPDFTQDKVKKWWAKCHASLLQKGVSGIWNDMNDPVLKMSVTYDPLQEDIHHLNKPHWQIRNIYANLQAQASLLAWQYFAPNDRPFILTRSAFCGMQQYAALWTGDNFSSWPQLKENLAMVLNLGLSGMPFCGADVGGFGGRRGLRGIYKFRRQKELFVRWMELGSLMPFFRGHSVLYSSNQEPWAFGKKHLNLIRKQIVRRYRLLPYFYHLFYESSQNTTPIVRPLFYHFDHVPNIFIDNHFLIGESLLAAPILEPGIKNRQVFLPAGKWFHYDNWQIYQGPAISNHPSPLGYLPLFVRAGSIIPQVVVAENAELSLLSRTLILEIYPNATINGRLYLDDGQSHFWRQGKYTLIRFRGLIAANGSIRLKATCSHKGFILPYRRILFRLPSDYDSMLIEKKHENTRKNSTRTELSLEDRMATVSQFELDQREAKQFFYNKRKVIFNKNAQLRGKTEI